jgi:hypothetical protein
VQLLSTEIEDIFAARHASQEISALKRAVQLVFGTKIEAAFLLKIGMISKVLGDRNSYS